MESLVKKADIENYGAADTTSVDGDITSDDGMGSVVESWVDNVKDYALTGEQMGILEFEGDVSLTNQVFNLTKNLVGCGVLALPSGIAAFGSAPSAIIPATVCTILMGLVFGYFFLLIGKICRLVGAVTYREAWEDTMGRKGAISVAAINMIKPGLCNLAYSMILADTFQSLFDSAGYSFSRTFVLLLITVVALLPLCMLKNLKALAPFSFLGSLGQLLTAIAMGIRYFDGSYDPARNGRFLKDLSERHQPKFGNFGARGAWSLHILVLVCMLFEAYVAHYNAPRFYIELERRSVPRFRIVIISAFGVSSLIFILMSCFGFLTFGVNSDGYILNNYSDHDWLATASRSAIAFAILFTYPVVFMGFRDGVFDLLPLHPAQETSHLLNMLTVILLTFVTIVAVLWDNLGLLNVIGGGTLATAVVFVFPTLMYRAAILQKLPEETSRAEIREVQFSTVLMLLGIAMGVVGVWMGMSDL